MNNNIKKPLIGKLDWKFTVLIIGIVLNFLVTVKVMNNDLKHITADIGEIKISVNNIIKKVDRNSMMIERLDERTVKNRR